jgi:hypothetical protein
MDAPDIGRGPHGSAFDDGADGRAPMTDASDPRQALDHHPRTSEPGIRAVQLGWRVYDRSGRLLGEVIERDDDSVLVSPIPTDGRGTRFPVDLVIDEVPSGRWATLSVSAHELDRLGRRQQFADS